ncbi:MAG: AAA family ATPase [Selenomonadaceae bacterium]|nr:AAA family ATPase [Selenomonadaceae bacterium]
MQAQNRPMPVGIEDFKKLVTGNYYFIDKTRFIRELIDTQGVVTLLTRPRRFGKTLSLSMLQYFFTLENAEENRKLFAGLDIERAGENYMSQQGTRPVLFLTLKEIRRPSHASMLAMLASLLQEVYAGYRCILDSDAMDDPAAEYFRRILAGKGSEEDMAISLKRLMAYLEKYYGTQPVLLLDEYDAPILSAWENGYYRECIDFMRSFLGSALKTNPYLGFAVLTGITRISKESIFSGLNNLDVCGVLANLYADAMGFTQEEAAKLMSECGMEDKQPELQQWYDGYLFGQTELYNPWSVINFVQHGCKFQRYWINVSGNSILQVLLRSIDENRYEELQGLLRFRDSSVEALIDEGIIYPDIETDENALYMMLLTTGYLKAIETWQDRRGRWWCRLQIPNREVLLAYEDEVLAKVAGSGNRVTLFAMLNAMAAGKAAVFQKHLGKILKDMASYHDTAQPESFYHGLMLGLTVLMEGEYRVESNRESGYGRFDLAFFPLNQGTPGVILELKAAKSEEDLEEKAKEALEQIAEKEYTAELSRQGVREIWRYGIAFHGKKICMTGM